MAIVPVPVKPPGIPGVPLLAVTPKGGSLALQAATAARVAALETAIEVDSYDVTAWDGRLAEAVREGTPGPVFERAVKQFPLAARIWTAYADWCEGQDILSALSVYERCLQSVPSLDLWTAYLAFAKRHRPLEDVLRAYGRATELLGTDWRAGLVWSEYMTLLKRTYNAVQKKQNPDAEVSGRLLAEEASPIDAARRAMKPHIRKKADEMKAPDTSEEEFARVGELLSIDVTAMRTAFQRAVSSAHASLEKLWVSYEQFEKSLGNPPLTQKLLAEYTPRYVRGKTAFKELQALASGMDFFAVAVPIRAKTSDKQKRLLEKWMSLIQYERTNPLRLGKKELQARVSLVYQQAALSCAFHAEIWHDFASWLDLGGNAEKGIACLREAVERFLPQDLTLRLLIAHRHELQELPPSEVSLQAAEDEYSRLLEDMPKPCPLALINKLGFVRRQRGAAEFRNAFLEATESSPHCAWEVYAFAALTEFHVYGSAEAAVGTFRLGLERYGEREPSLLVTYVNFLLGCNDLLNARGELSRGVLDRLQAGVRDSLSNRSDKTVTETLGFLWQKWARIERYFGDAHAVRRAMAFRDEEYKNLQRDQEVEEEAIAETPITLGLCTSIKEVEESFRFLHLIPHSSRIVEQRVEAPAIPPATPTPTLKAPASSPPVAPPAKSQAPDKPELLDQAVADASEGHRKLSSAAPAAVSVHIARPDVSKMLAFRPALDIVGRKGPVTATEEKVAPPVMIPKCLQDLLAVLPNRTLRGAKPDVDYLLTVLQTVNIPPIPVKELEHFRYDSLRLARDDEGGPGSRRLVKEEDGGSLFSSRPSFYRERLQAKRQRVIGELQQAKPEVAF